MHHFSGIVKLVLSMIGIYIFSNMDEQNQIRSSLDCMILNKSRIKAIEEAENKKFDLIVLDDGYQDLSFKKDMNIICFSSNQSIGNGFVIPSGPLRENLNTLKKAAKNMKKASSSSSLLSQIGSHYHYYYSASLPFSCK